MHANSIPEVTNLITLRRHVQANTRQSHTSSDLHRSDLTCCKGKRLRTKQPGKQHHQSSLLLSLGMSSLSSLSPRPDPAVAKWPLTAPSAASASAA